MSHALVDGYSFFHFMTSWARLTRGMRIVEPTRAPLTAALPAGESTSARLEQSGLHVGDAAAETAPETRQQIESVRFTRADIDRWCEEVEAEGGRRRSVNDVLVARLWRACALSRIVGTDETLAYVACPINVRPFLTKMSATHFGCASIHATASLPLGRLKTAPLSELARVVHDAVFATDRASVGATLAAWGALVREHRSYLPHVHVVHPTAGFLVTNLTQLPLTAVDFGSGPPVAFHADARMSRGAGLFSRENGDIEARIIWPSP
jgi:hypothetical protein